MSTLALRRGFTRPFRLSDDGVCALLVVRAGLRLREELSLSPPAAQGFDELAVGDEALARESRSGALRLQRLAVRVHHIQVTDNARAIAISKQSPMASGCG
jgi:hypothetical protein